MEIKFYNDLGIITFAGGTSGSAWKLTACDGLAYSSKSLKTARYAGTPGCETVEELENPRTITLSGDVHLSGGNDEYAQGLTVLGKRGTLAVKSLFGTRRISAACTSFTETARNGAYRVFCAQFVADNPFFESDTAEEFYLYKSVANLDKNFTFPGAFSKRISGGNVVCIGSAPAEPVITVVCGAECGSLSISNKTTGESINLNLSGQSGEAITLDVKNRTVRSSNGDDLTSCLTDESFFEGFCLMPGENEIELKRDSAETDMIVTCRYTPLYREAAV